MSQEQFEAVAPRDHKLDFEQRHIAEYLLGCILDDERHIEILCREVVWLRDRVDSLESSEKGK